MACARTHRAQGAGTQQREQGELASARARLTEPPLEEGTHVLALGQNNQVDDGARDDGAVRNEHHHEEPKEVAVVTLG